jgi:hypothetical protein
MSNWTKEEYGVEFNAEQLARALEPHEVAAEVGDVLDAIARTTRLKRK